MSRMNLSGYVGHVTIIGANHGVGMHPPKIYGGDGYITISQYG